MEGWGRLRGIDVVLGFRRDMGHRQRKERGGVKGNERENEPSGQDVSRL
jgi:hypothetical protein